MTYYGLISSKQYQVTLKIKCKRRRKRTNCKLRKLLNQLFLHPTLSAIIFEYSGFESVRFIPQYEYAYAKSGEFFLSSITKVKSGLVFKQFLKNELVKTKEKLKKYNQFVELAKSQNNKEHEIHWIIFAEDTRKAIANIEKTLYISSTRQLIKQFEIGVDDIDLQVGKQYCILNAIYKNNEVYTCNTVHIMNCIHAALLRRINQSKNSK